MPNSRQIFEDLGCITGDADPDFTGADRHSKTLRALAFHAHHRSASPQMKRTIVQEIERGAALTGPEIADAESLRSQLFTRIAELMTRYDFLVLPTTQVPAFESTRSMSPRSMASRWALTSTG